YFYNEPAEQSDPRRDHGFETRRAPSAPYYGPSTRSDSTRQPWRVFIDPAHAAAVLPRHLRSHHARHRHGRELSRSTERRARRIHVGGGQSHERDYEGADRLFSSDAAVNFHRRRVWHELRLHPRVTQRIWVLCRLGRDANGGRGNAQHFLACWLDR